MTTGTLTYAIVLVVGLLTGAATAQDVPDTVSSLPGIEVEASVDRGEAYIGDLITYRIAITYDSTYDLEPPPLGANLGGFDVKDYEPDSTAKLDGGLIRNVTTFKLTTFTTGDYLIPPMPLLFTLSDSTKRVVLADAVPIKIKSLLGEGSDTLDIKPLKAQYEFERKMNPLYLWGGIGLAVLVIALIIWLVMRKRKPEEEFVDLRPAWEIAFEELAFLQQKKLVEEEQYREYYFELTEIVRDYLGRIYEKDVLEMTTEEFMAKFEDVSLPGDHYEQIGRFFRHADLVKFAKFTPEQERTEADFKYAHDLVDDVRVEYERKEAELAAAEKAGQTPQMQREAS